MRIIVAGGRKFDDYSKVCNVLDEILKGEDLSKVEIISGRAIGTDRLGEQYAIEHGIKLITFEAEWFKLGRRAGIIRNGQMADYCSKDPEKRCLLVAFWNGSSRGTKNMIDQATSMGKFFNVHIVPIE